MTKDLELKPYKLNAEDYSAIGALITSCANLEQAVTLWFAKISNSSPGALAVILGTMPISSKIKLARQFAEMHGNDALKAHKKWFEHDTMTKVIRCRNTICHGVVVGINSEDMIAFQTTKVVSHATGKAVFEINLYNTPMIIQLGNLATKATEEMERDLQLSSLKEKLLSRKLVPHPKDRPQGQTQKPKSNPPQSSPA